MNLAGPLHLAWRYVARHRAQSLLLACALGVVMALPLAVRVLVRTAERQLRARAESTPLVAGPKGSQTDLMLSALHFRQGRAETLPVSACDDVRDTGLAEAIPLNLRFRSQGTPIVGTELEYFDFRRLKVAEGRMITRLGDCVVGAKAARGRGLHPGGAVYSSPEQVFDIAGIYPLKMRVTGILEATGTTDDEVIFVDVKTAWLIQGLGHGHDDLIKPENAAAVLSKKPGEVVANASVRMFNEVTDANVASFHFHGDETAFPIHAMIVLPHDAKAAAILEGRYQGNKEVQIIRPMEALEVLLGALFRIEGLIIAALALVGGASLAVAALVFGLSFRMRQREFATLAEVGVGQGTLWLAKVFEIAIIGFAAGIITVALTALLHFLADAAIINRLG
ncbi:MAG: hypothetical protein JWO94_3941 [Verrucomicrobiaceae bacterium]|nr:hypothetical protein [Verrucomicrobiaceae bacterium]